MESLNEWVAALSGKMVAICLQQRFAIAPDGTVELEGAGINVFEKKGFESEK